MLSMWQKQIKPYRIKRFQHNLICGDDHVYHNIHLYASVNMGKKKLTDQRGVLICNDAISHRGL